jgi:hypothetical protein
VPIKNYTTEVPANRSLAEIQEALVKHGATGMLYKYEQGTGRVEALQCLLRVKDKDVNFFSACALATIPTGIESAGSETLG